jgi:MFS family permease
MSAADIEAVPETEGLKAAGAAKAGRGMLPPGAKHILVVLALFMMLGFGDKAILGLVGPPMMDELGLSNSQFGAIGSSFSLLFSLSGVLVGLLGNRVPARWLLAVLALVWSLAQLPIVIPAAGYGVLIATRVLLGAGEGPAAPLAAHTAFGWVPPRGRALAAAILALGGSAGIIVGAPIMMAAMIVWGWRAPFAILGVLGFVWTVYWLSVGKDGPYASGASVPLMEPVGPKAQAIPIPVLPDSLPYRRLLTSGTWIGGVLGTFAVNWSLGLALTWLPTYLEEHGGYDRTTVSFLVGLPSIAAICAVLGTGWLSHRLLARGRPRRIAYGLVGAGALLVAAAATVAIPRVGTGPLLLVAVAIAFSAGTGLTPLTSAAIADVSPPGRRSGVLCTAFAVAAMGSVASPFVTGRIVDLSRSDDVGFGHAMDLTAVLLVVGAVLAAVLLRPERDAAALGGPGRLHCMRHRAAP